MENYCTPYQVPVDNNISTELCFKTKVWELQQKYSNLVYNYMKALQYGTICTRQYENLLMFKRYLLLLNRYDTRDIPNDTLVYNKITYTDIKKVINLLKNKF